MKRVLIFTLVIGLFAVQADAVVYTLTQAYALTLDDVAYSDGGAGNAMPALSPTTSTVTYGGGMQGDVGFFGNLDDMDADTFVWVKMGDPGADLSWDLSGNSYTDYTLFVANDNQSVWEARVFLTAQGTEYTSAWTTVNAFGGTTLSLNFAGAGITEPMLADVNDIGFYIRGELIGGLGGTLGYPSDPDGYHMSVIPVPPAVILGILGLGVVGLKLRRFA